MLKLKSLAMPGRYQTLRALLVTLTELDTELATG